MLTVRAVSVPGFKHWCVLGRAWGAQGGGWVAARAGRAQADSGHVCPFAVAGRGCLPLARFSRALAACWACLDACWWGIARRSRESRAQLFGQAGHRACTNDGGLHAFRYSNSHLFDLWFDLIDRSLRSTCTPLP